MSRKEFAKQWDLTLLDEFGTDKKAVKDRSQRPKNTPAPQKKRPTVMEVRKIEAMLQVAKENAEAERIA